MRRSLAFGVVLLALVGLASGDVAPTRGEIESRLSQLRRDLDLIEGFIDDGLALAKEDDPLQRARMCNALAEKLAQEIKQASHKKETARVVELGDLLQSVLVRGVADNLEAASKDAAKEGPRGKEIQSLGDRAADVTSTVETTLKKAYETLDTGAKESMAPALEGLSKAREEIESATKGKSRPREKEKGKSKDKGKGKGKKS